MLLTSTFSKLLADRSGATSIEYALMLGMMALVCITSFNAVGGASNGVWGDTATRITAVMR